MNVFYEFHKIVQHLQSEEIEYALIGGVAVAFHAQPRFTKDIDILICRAELERVTGILKGEGYFESSSPWTFRDSQLTLHRFMKVEEQDEMVVDILVAGNDRQEAIVSHAMEAKSKGTGVVRLATKPDLIWLKRQRHSKQDEADIESLGGDDEKP